ncbi:sodium-dependent neutral amino acid transporter B(0)AT3-like isoform X4 [Homarus americanus]|uniref:sodium-dependent neutral amino acid transporter B(0)AT3-like isoform X4 n=1 Tax=Homarus americanus TaxID=6706 RepID=UPI001C45CDDE|nr:sodium-dependent neutral amino acid transporter B(0)AT3-like isoform X4 [Homarus americanus]
MEAKRHLPRPVNLEEADDGVVEFSPLKQDDDEGTVTIEVPVAEERAAWGSKMQFMLSCISLSVGLGNVWRFPYLVQQDGGGAFLIPYLIMMVLEGAPLFLLELGIGQRLRQGSLGVWNLISPWWGGLGVASTIVSYLVGLYYNVIIAWCFYYLFNSFKSPLPFSTCPNETVEFINQTFPVAECELSSETAYFWYRQTIDASPSISETGGVKWWMALCLTISWVLVWLCIMKGIQSSGKVVYFTAIFPYCILVIFFGRAVTLKGASEGLKHMFTPDMTKLLDPTVWMDAACQVFYSLGLAFGSLIAFASYNPMKNNCKRDAIFMCFITVFTATFATIDIFAVLGFKAVANYEKCVDHNIKKLHSIMDLLPTHPQEVNITLENYEELWPQVYLPAIQEFYENKTHEHIKHCSVSDELNQAAEGTGLAFIVFTQAIVELPGSNFWSVCFFMMLLALGLGSQFGTMEGVITNMFDMKVFARVRKEILTGCVCLSSLLFGLIFCTGAGEYWLGMFDTFAGSMGLIMIAFFETIVISYVYGHKKFTDDIERMIGERPGLYWQATWRFISPLTIFGLVVTCLYYRIAHPPDYPAWKMELGNAVREPYPGWAMFVCLILLMGGFLPIPIVYLMRRCQCIRFDTDIHQASIKRVETTISTQGMIKGEESMPRIDTSDSEWTRLFIDRVDSSQSLDDNL